MFTIGLLSQRLRFASHIVFLILFFFAKYYTWYFNVVKVIQISVYMQLLCFASKIEGTATFQLYILFSTDHPLFLTEMPLILYTPRHKVIYCMQF